LQQSIFPNAVDEGKSTVTGHIQLKRFPMLGFNTPWQIKELSLDLILVFFNCHPPSHRQTGHDCPHDWWAALGIPDAQGHHLQSNHCGWCAAGTITGTRRTVSVDVGLVEREDLHHLLSLTTVPHEAIGSLKVSRVAKLHSHRAVTHQKRAGTQYNAFQLLFCFVLCCCCCSTHERPGFGGSKEKEDIVDCLERKGRHC
jgi:hypothetical protein